MTTASDKGSRTVVDKRVRLRQWIAKSARWLHLYLSMLSFGILLFFAVTGLTLNHADWFSAAVRTRQVNGRVAPNLLDPSSKAALIQAIRTSQHLHGAVDDVRTDDTSVSFTFKAPGYSADVSIDRPAGTYSVTEVRNGAVAVLNDLHKGHDAGKAWGWLIDASAILLTFVSLTGLGILFFIYKRRTSGLIVACIGIAVCLLLYRICVP